jgi:hypothetical protein
VKFSIPRNESDIANRIVIEQGAVTAKSGDRTCDCEAEKVTVSRKFNEIVKSATRRLGR